MMNEQGEQQLGGMYKTANNNNAHHYMSSKNHASVSTAGNSTVVIDSGLDLLNRVQMYQIAINKINQHKSKALQHTDDSGSTNNNNRRGLSTAAPGMNRNAFKFGSSKNFETHAAKTISDKQLSM